MSVPADVEDLITGAALSAHLATTVEDRPHVAPVWYEYDEGVIEVLTGGRKLANCRRNPRVAVSIEKLRNGAPAWTVVLQGRGAVVEDPGRIAAARERVFPKYRDRQTDGGERENREGERENGNEDAETETALIEITIGSATAQRY